MSTFDSALGRLVARNLVATEDRPGAPRGFTVDSVTSWFSWIPPQRQNFTHYRLRIDHDDGDPDLEMSAGTFGVHLFRGSRFWLSTFNSFNGLESSQVMLTFETSAPGGTTEDIQVTAEHTLTADTTIPCIPSPQSGARLLVFIAQDATGGWLITWASCFKNAPTDLDTTPSTLSVVGFVYKGGFWYFDGSFGTGLGTV